MNEKKETRGQRRRRLERELKEVNEEIDRVLLPIPEHIIRHFKDEPSNILSFSYDLQPEDRAPAHMVHEDEHRSFDVEKQKELSKLGNASKTEWVESRISELKIQYGSKWGRPDQAEYIAMEENVSIRTIQRWFKKSKK